jgi:hypothetical protein
MILGAIFTPFIEKRPVCVLARGILERLFDPTRPDSTQHPFRPSRPARVHQEAALRDLGSTDG